MKLQKEHDLFLVKWTAYNSEGYQDSYKEEAEEKKLTNKLCNSETVMERAGALMEWFLTILEAVFNGKFITVII